MTDTTHYGFEVRSTRQWTESAKLNERFKVTTSPFQDENWMLQLFSPTFIDWLGMQSPADFSFELAYGSLLCSTEEDDPTEDAARRPLGRLGRRREADRRREPGAVMQINRTGYLVMAIMLLVFLGGGALFTWVVDLGPAGILGPIWMVTAVLVCGGLAIWAVREARRGKHEQWLWKNGLRGKGTIVSAKAGALINEQPVMRFELDLDVPGQSPRRVTRKIIVSNFAAPLMQPGLVLPVYANPQDPEDLLIVW